MPVCQFGKELSKILSHFTPSECENEESRSCQTSLPCLITDVSVVLSAFSLILWSGPSRFLPGYTDTLPHAATRQGTVRGERWLSRDGRYFSVFRSEGIK